MEKMELDILLKQSLTPDSQPEESLKQTILERMETEDVSEKIRSLETSKKWRKRSMLPKVAAVVLAILVVGAGTVYAAGRMLNQVYVSKNFITTGPEDYQIFEQADLMSEDSETIIITPEKICEEMGGPNDKWLSKSVFLSKDDEWGIYLTSTQYTYPDYLTAVNDAKMGSIFHTIPGMETKVSYMVYEADDETAAVSSPSLEATFAYKHGTVKVNQCLLDNQTPEEIQYWGGYASKISRGNGKGDFSEAIWGETDNVRKYVSKSGTEFTLVDYTWEKWGYVYTIVLISYDNVKDIITFEGLSEQEMQEVLDMIDL